MSAKPITVEEWRAELERVIPKSSSMGMTVEEIGDLLGLKQAATLRRLHLLKKVGRLGQGWRDGEDILGHPRRKPVYWVKK